MNKTQTLPTYIYALDLETTGLDTKKAHIVSAAIVKYNTKTNQHETKAWFVNPGINIPKNAIEIHGITNKQAQEKGMDHKQAVIEICQEVEDHINKGHILIAYNAPYDFTVLNNLKKKYLKENLNLSNAIIIDPMILDKILDFYRKGSRSLENVAKHYHVGFDTITGNAHEASSDAIITAKITQKIYENHPYEKCLNIKEITQNQKYWAKQINKNIESYMRKKNNDPHFKIKKGWPVYWGKNA